jgi:mRNA interferase YafQ
VKDNSHHNDTAHYELASTGSFKRDLKTIIRRGYDICLLNDTVDMLLEGKLLPEKYKDHPLIGKWTGYRECHRTKVLKPLTGF